VHEDVELRISSNTVEVYHRNVRVASHRRSFKPGFTTVPEHMPKSHRAHLEWSPSRFIRWAGTIGPQTQKLVDAILTERPHPEQGYRSCLGILRLAKTYGEQRLEAACRRAVAVRARSYKHVQAILKNGLDQAPPIETNSEPPARTRHVNVRGPEYYN
jgi:transposase